MNKRRERAPNIKLSTRRVPAEGPQPMRAGGPMSAPDARNSHNIVMLLISQELSSASHVSTTSQWAENAARTTTSLVNNNSSNEASSNMVAAHVETAAAATGRFYGGDAPLDLSHKVCFLFPSRYLFLISIF